MFVFKTAFKYIFSKNHGQRNNTFLSIFGIALSILAVIVVTSVMNGLQTFQLERLKNIESFDLIVNDTTLTEEKLKEIKGVEDSFEFIETSILLTNKEKGLSSILRLRAFDFDDIQNSRMNNVITVVDDIDVFKSGLNLSYLISNNLDLDINDPIQVTFLAKGKSSNLSPKNKTINFVSNYSCKLNDYSTNTVLMDFDLAKEIINPQSVSIGLFLNGNEKQVIKVIKSLDENAQITTWQEYNRVIFSALVLEKAMVYLFLGFMFIILCINLKNSTSRLINLKANENAILTAIGATKKSVLCLYITQGLFITIIGEILGLLFSLIFVKNINSIFTFVDNIAFSLTGNGLNLSAFAFYTLVNTKEILLVLIAILLLSVLFIVLGCKKLFKQEIMEAILNVSY